MSNQQQVCLRCGSQGARHAAAVPHPSIFQRHHNCPHAPFCTQCALRKEQLTLPQCQCRALIVSWEPPLPEVEVQNSAARQRATSRRQRSGSTSGASSPAHGERSPRLSKDPAEVMRRALAAVDGLNAMMERLGGGSPTNKSPKRGARRSNCEGGTVLRADESVPKELKPERRKNPGTASEAAEAPSEANQTLAESLRLRGGRPAAKAESGKGSRWLALCRLWG